MLYKGNIMNLKTRFEYIQHGNLNYTATLFQTVWIIAI